MQNVQSVGISAVNVLWVYGVHSPSWGFEAQRRKQGEELGIGVLDDPFRLENMRPWALGRSGGVIKSDASGGWEVDCA